MLLVLKWYIDQKVTNLYGALESFNKKITSIQDITPLIDAMKSSQMDYKNSFEELNQKIDHMSLPTPSTKGEGSGLVEKNRKPNAYSQSKQKGAHKKKHHKSSKNNHY
jgi:hypothetical protein